MLREYREAADDCKHATQLDPAFVKVPALCSFRERMKVLNF